MFHVPVLGFELRALRFDGFASLQEGEGFFFEGGVTGGGGPEFAHAALEGGEFGGEFGVFDVEGFDVCVYLSGS